MSGRYLGQCKHALVCAGIGLRSFTPSVKKTEHFGLPVSPIFLNMTGRRLYLTSSRVFSARCCYRVGMHGINYREVEFTNLGFHTGDRDLLDYCIIGLQAVNDAQNIRITEYHDQ